MAFANKFNFYIKEMKAELRENELDDLLSIPYAKFLLNN